MVILLTSMILLTKDSLAVARGQKERAANGQLLYLQRISQNKGAGMFSLKV